MDDFLEDVEMLDEQEMFDVFDVQHPPDYPPDEQCCEDSNTAGDNNFVTEPVKIQIIDTDVNKFDKTSEVTMFGVDEHGVSFTLHVTGWHYFFYVEDMGKEPADLVKEFNETGDRVTSVEQVVRTNVHGYQTCGTYLYKITLRSPSALKVVKKILADRYPSAKQFESNTEPLLRAMVDIKLRGMTWIRVNSRYERSVNKTTCDVEAYVHVDNIVVLDEISKICRLLVFSVDIETLSLDPEKGEVIQISVVSRYLESSDPPKKYLFGLGTISPIEDVDVRSFMTEEKLLSSWADFIRDQDPDVILSYNGVGFDIPFLLKRAEILKVEDFPYLGRLLNKKTKAYTREFNSKQQGKWKQTIINMEGRLILDLLEYLRANFKLRSYRLDAVSKHFLGDQKADMDYKLIPVLQNGSPDDRKKLAEYCVKDSVLPLDLMDKLMIMYNIIGLARVTGVPFRYILSRGQQIKVLSQLMRRTAELGYVIPVYESKHRTGETEIGYKGATVIEPVRGYYKKPITTLDFASLYPSIMMAHNLCYTTLADKHTPGAQKTPCGHYFVDRDHKPGLLPQIVQDLLAARKQAKKDLKRETDPFKRAVLDGRQLALKISANSVYGFTGAVVGFLPCLEISSSVTAYGREMIELTKEKVEGFKHELIPEGTTITVIYGDTDSVMIDFGVDDMATVMRIGEAAAAYVTKFFATPIKLEFEKVYFPYLLINKKRYAGCYWTNPERYDRIDSKGLATVRRDACRFVQETLKEVLRIIMEDMDEKKAIAYVKEQIRLLMTGKISIYKLILSRKLSRDNYANKQPHSELAKTLAQRDPISAPKLGDRVPFVIINGESRKSKMCDMAEDPLYIVKKQIPVNYTYYLTNQLAKPTMQILDGILGGVGKSKHLFATAAVRKKTIHTPKTAFKKNSVLNFTKRQSRCPVCRNLKRDKDPLCDRCMPEQQKHYIHYELRHNEWSEKSRKIAAICYNCKGTRAPGCEQKDCHTLYERIHVNYEEQRMKQILEKFSLEW